MKNKKKLLIPIILIVTVLVLILLFIIIKNHVNFSLIGEDNITIEYGEIFEDPGFIAKNGFGKDIKENVKVENEVNNNKSGTYKIVYTLDYNNSKKELIRTIIVKDVDLNKLKIVLNGSETTYLIKDSTYNEQGAKVINTINDTNFIEANLETIGSVDTSKTGTYEVKYELNYKGQTISKIRKVIVFDVKYQISPEKVTDGKVKIKLDLSDVRDYSFTKLPDNYSQSSKNVEYEVSSNGTYTFVIVLQNKEEFKKEIKIDNIIGKYACSGEITNAGTRLTVSPTNSEIKDYEWNINGITDKGSNIYNKNKIINKASVNLVLENGKKYELTCNIKDRLVYHFKYDENNTKPFMRCNTYTAADKAKYDEMLKKAVAEAGYGTRAGVVAAARFIVGALDYKVPYQGGSKYSKAGLNIGQNGAWGCSGVGLDCFYFVYWALSQNGLPLGALYGGTKYKLRDDINKTKVGDYVLTPCNSTTCKNVYKINHIGLIIGIDDKYVYVAESTTGNINALVVTKLDKANLPSSGNLSLVRHIDYPSEGNVTNMWISE